MKNYYLYTVKLTGQKLIATNSIPSIESCLSLTFSLRKLLLLISNSYSFDSNNLASKKFVSDSHLVELQGFFTNAKSISCQNPYVEDNDFNYWEQKSIHADCINWACRNCRLTPDGHIRRLCYWFCCLETHCTIVLIRLDMVQMSLRCDQSLLCSRGLWYFVVLLQGRLVRESDPC